MTRHAPESLHIVDHIVHRLHGRFGSAFDSAVVRETVLDSVRRYRHLDHPSHHRRSRAAQLATDRLDARLWAAGHDAGSRPASVLFICSGNAGRSQIAAAMLRAIAPATWRIASAGDRPAARILPAAIEALDELGVAMFGEYPKPLTPELVEAADYIVVLNCNDRLEALDGHAFRTWNIMLESTSGKTGMRRTRDEIVDHVYLLAIELGLEARSV